MGRADRTFHGVASAAILVSVLVASCGGDEPPLRLSNGEEYSASVIERGAEVYRISCQSCHGATGLGGRGAPLVDIWKSLTVAKHRETIVEGRGELMPAFGVSLTDDEIDAVLAYERAALSSENSDFLLDAD